MALPSLSAIDGTELICVTSWRSRFWIFVRYNWRLSSISVIGPARSVTVRLNEQRRHRAVASCTHVGYDLAPGMGSGDDEAERRWPGRGQGPRARLREAPSADQCL